MGLDSAFFYFFALLVLGGGILTVTRRSAVHSAVSLIVSLIGVAGLFLLQQAEFLFAVQIVLYVGGIMVLFLYVIMLVNLDAEAHKRQFNKQWWIALACVAAVVAEAVFFLTRGAGAFRLAPAATPAGSAGNTERIADSLFSEYLLPFEVASVLLLAAVVGSVLLAKKRV
ncbi:MAG TPA: NADH-quinone oxidoreductase subunit J [Bryobacteraceae bacterium]|nr:NADH-quinone oxidoreductase subunit J [Bryobacteraceae bacterium]